MDEIWLGLAVSFGGLLAGAMGGQPIKPSNLWLPFKETPGFIPLSPDTGKLDHRVSSIPSFNQTNPKTPTTRFAGKVWLKSTLADRCWDVKINHYRV